MNFVGTFIPSLYSITLSYLLRLCLDSPDSYKRYRPKISNVEALQTARSLSFIHLLLKVRFGISDFLVRHGQITEGSGDGGLDAYHIDEDTKKVYLIQSKFRANSKNFESKSIETTEMVKMEVERIIKGNPTDSNGVPFNDKIIAFQNKISSIRDIAKYDYIVLFLCNLTKLNDEQIRRLISNLPYEIYNSNNAYNRLVFPLCAGTYFDPDEIIIAITLANKEHPMLKQTIETDFGEFNVRVMFIPTKELGRILSKYKNAILKFNPRNFLSLKKRSVNENIRKSILENEKNNFAILNNGVTILSDNVKFQESTGKENQGQLVLTRPQILNGGQTAYTLSTIYDQYLEKSDNPLISKEVLVKIVTPINDSVGTDSKFVDLISNATNQQNEVSEADRRSNHEIQIELQNLIYDNYGYLYERKSGEYHDGIQNGYVNKKLVIDRLKFIKAFWAYDGHPAAARRTSEKVIFKEENFYKILHDVKNFHEMFFSYLIFTELERIEGTYKAKVSSISDFGYGLMYGKWAVLNAIGLDKPVVETNSENIFPQAIELTKLKLDKWKDFDSFIEKKHWGSKYFNDESKNFELYYKVDLLDEDIREYFLK